MPSDIQDLTRAAARKFDKDPNLPSLRLHELEDRKTSSHVPGSFSVSINMQYRAIYFVAEDGVNVWYWIGTHAEYDRFTGAKKT